MAVCDRYLYSSPTAYTLWRRWHWLNGDIGDQGVRVTQIETERDKGLLADENDMALPPFSTKRSAMIPARQA